MMSRDAAAPELRALAFDRIDGAWRTCLELAWEAHCAGSLPIGAVVVGADGAILARGRNRLGEDGPGAPHLAGTPYLAGTPLAHAEVNALLELGPVRATPRPRLLTTTEPCPLCMGAARMAGVGHVAYASRDPWAGCAVMADTVPYLRRRGPTVSGPEVGLEAPLVAWQTAVHVRDDRGGVPAFLEVWSEAMPGPCSAGLRLAEDGALEDLAARGAEVEEVWTVLAEALAVA